jgi:NAD(P) transhydrogenase subunit alpha
MILGVLKEASPGETRVALVPSSLKPLVRGGFEVLVEPGAGIAAGYLDADYAAAGARLAASREQVFAEAAAVLTVRSLGAAADGAAELGRFRKGQVLIGMLDPLSAPQALQKAAPTGITAFALELLPRITRAQSMDVLSSMASIAGYKAVLIAASELPRMFPMMMTAAGTITPARVLVVGAGVAGLQAIATAKRLGAVVSAYDVRPAVKEQVESLGGKFVELPLESAGAEDRGGYAKAQDEAFYRKQRELMARVVAASDVVITTAAVPGKRAPVLVTTEMIRAMAPGSVIVDLAAERGGNCEPTRAGETVGIGGVRVIGPVNLPATVPYHASQMYARNVATFVAHVFAAADRVPDASDEIVRETLVLRDGEVAHPRVREALGITAEAPAR